MKDLLTPLEANAILSILIEYRQRYQGKTFSFDIDSVILKLQTELISTVKNEMLLDSKIYRSQLTRFINKS
jgi:hypothetical protein